ncbi:MAG: sulfatase [Acidimicrobiales bacterium]
MGKDAAGRKNVLVIVSDTFRRDNLEAYGGSGHIAPKLNELARKSFIFERFYACSFPTVPARADLLTGQAAFTRQGWGPLRREWVTMAGMAVEAGYQTMCVTDVPFLLRDGYGYDRGFEDYIWVRGQRDRAHPESADDVYATWRQESDHFAPRTMGAAAGWLERRVQSGGTKPFLLVVDTWDPHEPWDPPAHYIRLHQPDYAGEEVPYPAYQPLERTGEGKDVVTRARAGYLGKVTMVDSWIGYLLDRLRVLGLEDDTVVLFLTDHGFYFGEHGYLGKSVGWRIGPVSTERSAVGEMERSPLYEEVVHIPLLVRVPRWSGGTVDGMASMPDVAATVLQVCGVEADMAGMGLLDEASRKGVGRRDFTVTSWPMHLPGETTQAVDAATRKYDVFMPMTISTKEWSLLYSSDADPVELYDLRQDPQQQDNVAMDHPGVVSELHEKLVEFLEQAQCPELYLAPRRRLVSAASASLSGGEAG